MAGIYIHIPFCKTRCSYCDFYKTTATDKIYIFINALLKEMKLQKHYLADETINTIYIGGGTPSVLGAEQLKIIFESLTSNFKIGSNVEITLEANPDDLSLDYILLLKKYTPVNRLSIGIQSFKDNHLQLISRRHNASQALLAIENSINKGFENLSIDLIYGIPGMSLKDWEYNLNKAFTLGIKHLSAYCLTVERGTIMDKMIKNNELLLPDEETSVQMFEKLIEICNENQFLHYEISNFAREGFLSNHNSNYWKGFRYLGLGPSAHSFNKSSRQWNVSHLNDYISGIDTNKKIFTREVLDNRMQFNEYVLTMLRTMWGIDMEYVVKKFGIQYQQLLQKNSAKYIKAEELIRINNLLVLTKKGKFVSDAIITDLLVID